MEKNYKKYKNIIDFITNKEKKNNTKVSNERVIGVELGDYLSDETGGFVFVGCNPSGANLNYYEYYFGNEKNKDKKFEDHPENAVIRYSPEEDRYKEYKEKTKYKKEDDFIKQYENFVKKECKFSGPCSKLDVFCIVIKRQADLKVFLEKNKYKDQYKEFFRGMLKIFAETIIKLDPKVIVVANGFIREIFVEDKYKDFRKGIISCNKNPYNDGGGWQVSFTGDNGMSIEKRVYFSSMLSGSGRLDKGSREILADTVRCYIEQKMR